MPRRDFFVIMVQETEYIEDGRYFHGMIPAVMGSKLDMLIVGIDRQDADSLWKGICGEAGRLEGILNANDRDSETGKFNSGRMLSHSAVSEELGDIIELCKDYRLRTCNAFDVALGKMAFVDHDEEDGTLSLYGARLDFGSFAKGLLLKRTDEILRGGGVGCAFVNFGNSFFLTIGAHPCGDAWKISLSNPFSRMPVEEVCVKDGALAFSCNAPGSVGRVIDPATGKGVESRVMCVAMSKDPLDAKVLSTALMVTGPEKIDRLKEEFPDCELAVYSL